MGASDFNIKLKIPFIKNVSNALSRSAGWTGGNKAHWNKLHGRARSKVPYYKPLYGDFRTELKHLAQPLKTFIKLLMKIKNGGSIKDKYVNNEYSQMIKNIIDKISENL